MPFLFSFHPALRFRRTWSAFFPANIIVALVFIAWDALFTRLGVWGFNPKYLCGIYLLNLPIEEVMFFICIPYASVFTYHCLKVFFKRVFIPAKTVSAVLSVLLLVAGIFAIPRLYTTVTFVLLSVVLTYFSFVRKSTWLSHFYLSFLIILLPFFIVNGLLTGTGLDEAVVWYNDAENLGLRLLTIPMEDVFYGMLLLVLNTGFYEGFMAVDLLTAEE